MDPQSLGHGDCDNTSLHLDRATQLFGAEYANIQPQSGSQASQAVQLGVLKLLATEASVRKTMASLGEIRATLVRTTTASAGRRPMVMLAPELTTEQRRAVKVFDLERWFPDILSCMTARPIKP